MKVEEFIQRIEEEFDDIEPGKLKPESEFRKVMDWNSIKALLLISLADADFGATLTADDLKNAVTINDLYHTIVTNK